MNDFGACANKFGMGPFLKIGFLKFVMSSYVIFDNLLDTCPDWHFVKTILYFTETTNVTPSLKTKNSVFRQKLIMKTINT